MSPIDCREALARIALYVDGELVGESSIEIHEHVEACPPCGERAAFERRLKDLLRASCGGCGELPPDLAERLRALLDADGR